MNRGFSLVELSIVLVILGLLTGGILAGQSLIRAAELRSVGTEAQRYITAANSFRDKYFAVPGDFNGATKFWSRQVGSAWCVTNSGAAVATPGTCDGEGNGVINAAGGPSQTADEFQFWRQLALAGLLEGSYNGLSGAGGIEHTVLGTNAPQSKLGTAGWSAATDTVGGGDTQVYAVLMGNYLEFGTSIPTSRTYGAALKPEEAWNIDTKLDDGKPARGRILARFWNDLCATPDDGATFTNTNLAASYKLSDSAIRCALYFKQAY